VTIKSVLEIDIDDGQFDKFHKLFDQYQQALYKMPGAWKEVGKAEKPLLNDFERGVAALLAQHTLTQELNDAEGKRANALVHTDSLWKSMAKSSASFATGILWASREVLKWGTLGIGGLATGSLFGFDRMARDVSNDRQQSLGYGMSIGEMKAFRTNFNRMVNPDQFLDFMATAETDKSSKAYSSFVSLMGRPLTGNTQNDTLGYMKGIYALVQKTPAGLLSTVLNSRNIPLSAEQANVWKGTQNSEFGGLIAQDRSNISSFSVSEATARGYQETKTQLSRNWDTIVAAFETKVGALSGPVGDLSTSFAKLAVDIIKSPLSEDLFKSIGKGIHNLSDDLKDPKFEKSVKDFFSDTGGVSKAFQSFWKELQVDLPAIQHTLHVLAHPYDAAVDAAADAAATAVPVASTTIASVADAIPNLLGLVHAPGANPTKGRALGFLAQLDQSRHLPPGTMETLWAKEASQRFDVPDSATGNTGPFQLSDALSKHYGVRRGNFTDAAYAASDEMAKYFAKYRDTRQAFGAYFDGEPNIDAAISMAKYRKQNWFDEVKPKTRDYVTDSRLNGLAPLNPLSVQIGVNLMNSTGSNVNMSVAALAPLVR
jgi:hypothetical protein